MWQKLSLRARINLLLAFVLALGLAINIARLVLEATPRVQAEDQSVIRLAREFVETIVAGLNEAPDPDARLDRIVRDLSRLRHVSVTRQDDAAEIVPQAGQSDDDDDHALAAGVVRGAGSSGEDLRERADHDPWQTASACDHVASR